jgi:hypothetical protein
MVLSRQVSDTSFVHTNLELPDTVFPYDPVLASAGDHLVVLWNAFDLVRERVDIARVALATGLVSKSETLTVDLAVGDIDRVADGLVAAFANTSEPRYVWSRSSSDGGESWSDPVQLGLDRWGGILASKPRLAAAGDVVYCVFELDPASGQSVVYRTLDMGASWSFLRTVSADEVGFGCTRIAAWGDDVIVAGSTWAGREFVHLVCSSDRGETWSPSIEVRPDPPYTEFKCPEIAIDAAGTWHVVAVAGGSPDFFGGLTNLVHVTTSDRGVSWSAPDTLNCIEQTVHVTNPERNYGLVLEEDDVCVVWPHALSGEIASVHVSSRAFPDPPVFSGPLRATAARNPLPRGEPLDLLVVVPRQGTLRSVVLSVTGHRLAGWTSRGVGPGTVTLTWDGRDDDNRIVGAGVYFWLVDGGELGTDTVRQVLY